MHSTNYFNTFIKIAEDSPVQEGQIPPQKGDKKSIANFQFDMLYENPYHYTSDEIIFEILSIRKGFLKADLEVEREAFFSKGQPCFRTSPLGKRYGWGIHYNEEGKMAIFAADSEEYEKFLNDTSLNHTQAMRSKRK